jgi:hypothetical protein
MKKVLPDNLMYSLYRAHDVDRDLSQMSSDSTLRDLFSRLDANGSGLDDLSNLTNLHLDLDAINEKSMRDIIKKMDSMLSKIDSNMVRENDRTLPLKLKDKVKVKDFNVNINLNLRVLKEEKSSPIVGKGGFSLKAGLGYSKPTFEEKRKTSDSIKLIQEIKDKFRKKAQPNQLATSKKGSIDKEYKIESDPYKGGLSGRRLGASSKDIQVTTSKTSAFNKEGFGKKSSIEVSKESPITIKATHPSLKIKNFDKVGRLY